MSWRKNTPINEKLDVVLRCFRKDENLERKKVAFELFDSIHQVLIEDKAVNLHTVAVAIKSTGELISLYRDDHYLVFMLSCIVEAIVDHVGSPESIDELLDD